MDSAEFDGMYQVLLSFKQCDSDNALWVEGGGSKQNGVRVHATDYEIYVS